MRPDVYAWMRLRAAGILAQFGNVGADSQVYNALLHLVTNLKSVDDRCEAASLLAKLKLEGAKIDGAATADQLLKLAADVGDAELNRVAEFEAKQNSPAAGQFRGRDERRGGYEASAELDTQGSFPRRPLMSHLLSLKQVLNVTKPSVPPDAQAKFDAILKAIDPAIEAAANKDTGELSIANSARQMSVELKRIAATPAPAAAASPLDGLQP
jgi:hypothetical protein